MVIQELAYLRNLHVSCSTLDFDSFQLRHQQPKSSHQRLRMHCQRLDSSFGKEHRQSLVKFEALSGPWDGNSKISWSEADSRWSQHRVPATTIQCLMDRDTKRRSVHEAFVLFAHRTMMKRWLFILKRHSIGFFTCSICQISSSCIALISLAETPTIPLDLKISKYLYPAELNSENIGHGSF